MLQQQPSRPPLPKMMPRKLQQKKLVKCIVLQVLLSLRCALSHSFVLVPIHVYIPILWWCIYPVDSLHIKSNANIVTVTRSTFHNNSTNNTYDNTYDDDDVVQYPMSPSQSNRKEGGGEEGDDSHHVCIMVEPSPFTYISGYANRFQKLLQYIHKYHCHMKYSVDVITTEVVVAESSSLPTTFSNTTIPIHYCSGMRLPFYPSMSIVSPYFWKNNKNDSVASILRRIQQQQQPSSSSSSTKNVDLLHVSSPGFMIFYAIFYSRYYSIPLLISYHTHLPIYVQSYIPYKIVGPIIQWIAWQFIRIIHSFADLTVVTSPQIYKEFVEQHHVPRCAVWQKGIDTHNFHPKHRNVKMRQRMMGLEGAHRKCNVRDKHLFLMLYVGRLGVEKRLKDLSDILDRLSEQYSDIKSQIRLCIVGDGPQRMVLEQYFEKYVQEGIVQFMGVLHGLELSQAYASSDIFILPSDSETLGFVVMESMASGVPVVGVNAGGVPDLIDHNRTGLLVDLAGDIPTFVEHIMRLKEDVYLRNEMSRNARTEMERHSWTGSMMKLVDELYMEARHNFHSRIEQRIIRFYRRISHWNPFLVQPQKLHNTLRQA